MDENEYYGGNHRTQEIKTCGSKGHTEGGGGEEDENYKFFLNIKE
jgi:hypothetical protein